MKLTDEQIKRFWAKVNKTDTCWLWTASINNCGYGEIRINKKLYKAHRISYIITNVTIPDTQLVCHNCDVRNCVNPSHLFLGTSADNRQDCLKKNRYNQKPLSKTHCVNGHEYTPENSVIKTKTTTFFGLRHYRICKTCRKNQRTQLRKRKQKNFK